MKNDSNLIEGDVRITEVPDSDLARMLGMSPSKELRGAMAELATSVRQWFQENISPWSVRRYFDISSIEDDSVLLKNGVRLNSPELARRFKPFKPHGIVVIALSVGAESEKEATERLKAGLPDEWIAMDAYASALVEVVQREECLTVCMWAAENDATALASYAPGYDGWPLSDQQVLFDLLVRDKTTQLEERLLVHPFSHMLSPIKSSICVIGITERLDVAEVDTAQALPCTSCAHPSCTFRRARN